MQLREKSHMHCHDIKYEIMGNDLQFVLVSLEHGKTAVAEAGAMMYMEDGIIFETKMGDGSDFGSGFFKKLWNAGKRRLNGAAFFMTHFTYPGETPRRVAFSAPFPGQILALNLGELQRDVLCNKDNFICAALGTCIETAFNKKGKEGLTVHRLNGDGMIFLHASGNIVEIELENSSIRADAGCVIAFQDGITLDITAPGGLKSMVFGGGVSLAKLSGSGKVWLQSLPFSALTERILSHAPSMLGKVMKPQVPGVAAISAAAAAITAKK